MFLCIIGYGWWFNTEDHHFKATVPSVLCVGFTDSINLVKKTFLEQGPFDGILGFSQGAAFVSILCAMKKKQCKYKIIYISITIYYMQSTHDHTNFFEVLEIEFDFVIIISGFKSLCAPHSIYYDEEIDIPSLHICGENDQVIPAGRIITY